MSHAASSPWTVTRVVPELGRAPDGNPQAVRDAGLGGKVRTSWSQRTVHDAVLLMQGLGWSPLCQSRLMPGWAGWGGSPQAQSFLALS